MTDPSKLFDSIMKGVVEEEESPEKHEPVVGDSESLFTDHEEEHGEDDNLDDGDDGDDGGYGDDGDYGDDGGESGEDEVFDDMTKEQEGSSMACKTTSSDRNRIKRQCVVCGKQILYLAHHLTRQHKILDPGRRMRLLYLSRSINPIRRVKPPQYKRKTRDCIFPGCYAKALNRLDHHLVAVHKLKRGSAVFTQILTKTRVGRPQPEVKAENCSKKEIDGKSSVFERAGKHLHLLAGGAPSAKKTVHNHVLQMEHMAKMADGVPNLFKNSTRLRHIVTTMQKTKAPKTIMKYLQSVRKLGSYMMVEEEEAMLLGIPQSKLAKTERLASAIINGLRPLAKKRESQLKAQIRDKLIDPSDVRKFCNLLKKEASPHINRLSNGEKIPWTDLLLVRNYIIIELLLAGAPRSGVITKFSLGHFEKAQKLVREDGSTYWIGNVDEHKTASSHGPARLVFSAEVYRVAKVYADHGRVQTANADIMDVMKSESPFFLDNKGREVTRVAQTVYRLWKSRGFNGSLNPTHLRYTAATKACENLDTLSKRGVADLMAHTEATQEHFYRALQANDKALDASLLVRQSICPQMSSNDDPQLEPDDTTTEGIDEVEEAEPEEPNWSRPKRKRRVFSNEVEEYLKSKLKAKLEKCSKKKKIALKDIVRSIYEEGQEVLGCFSLQSVYDKVRHSHYCDDAED